MKGEIEVHKLKWVQAGEIVFVSVGCVTLIFVNSCFSYLANLIYSYNVSVNFSWVTHAVLTRQYLRFVTDKSIS